MADDIADNMAMGDKTDQERIQALVSWGKITQAEANRLMAALQDTDSGNVEPVESEAETNQTADSAENMKRKTSPARNDEGGVYRGSSCDANPVYRLTRGPALGSRQYAHG